MYSWWWWWWWWWCAVISREYTVLWVAQREASQAHHLLSIHTIAAFRTRMTKPTLVRLLVSTLVLLPLLLALNHHHTPTAQAAVLNYVPIVSQVSECH